MNAIMGVADLLAKSRSPRSKNKYVQIIRRAGDNLLNLINDILDLSKVEASQLELERTGFSLHDLLEKVTEMVAVRAQEKGLALVCEVAPNVPPAWSATQHGSARCCSIWLVTRSSSRNPAQCPTSHIGWGFSVRRIAVHDLDTGIGISRETLGRVLSNSRKPIHPPRAGSEARGWG